MDLVRVVPIYVVCGQSYYVGMVSGGLVRGQEISKKDCCSRVAGTMAGVAIGDSGLGRSDTASFPVSQDSRRVSVGWVVDVFSEVWSGSRGIQPSYQIGSVVIRSGVSGMALVSVAALSVAGGCGCAWTHDFGLSVGAVRVLPTVSCPSVFCVRPCSRSA